MTLTFPGSPTIGQRAETGGRTYEWNGQAWDLVGSGIAGPQGPLGPTGPNGGVYADVPTDSVIYGRRNGTWVDIAGEANLQVRRGTAAEVAVITPLEGEPVWATDDKALYVGDGTTAGGIPVGNYPLAGFDAEIDYVAPSYFINAGAIWVSDSLQLDSLTYPSGLSGGNNPHVAGNARGAGAVDFTTARTVATEVASGQYSFAGPGTNTASGTSSVAFQSGTASGTASVAFAGTASGTNAISFRGTASADNAISFRGTADQVGKIAFGLAPGIDPTLGRGQAVMCALRWQTSNATPAAMRRYGTTTTGTAGYPITSDVTLFGTVEVCGLKSSDGTVYCHYLRKFAIRNDGGTTQLLGSVTTVGTDEESDAGLDVSVTANDTTDCLDVTVTGLASTTIRWMAVIRGVEMAL